MDYHATIYPSLLKKLGRDGRLSQKRVRKRMSTKAGISFK
jgi:hypothetical protein